jgi:hypothetical protein
MNENVQLIGACHYCNCGMKVKSISEWRAFPSALRGLKSQVTQERCEVVFRPC